MKKSIFFVIFALATIALALDTLVTCMTSSTAGVSSGTTTVSVESKTVTVCFPFEVKVTVTDAKNIVGYTINLRYNTTLLKLERIEKGDFLPPPPKSTAWNFTNEELGTLQLEARLNEPIVPANGNGTLAMVKFHCKGEGVCNLTLYDTKLKDRDGNEILPTTQNGRITQTTQPVSSIPIDRNSTICPDLLTSQMDTAVFVIKADNLALDFNGATVQSSPKSKGVCVEIDGRRNITIANGTIYNFQKGLTVKRSENIRITNMTVIGSGITDIEIRQHTNNVQVVNNLIAGRHDRLTGEGIYVTDVCSDVNITGNVVEDIDTGIFIENSFNNSVSKNTIRQNNCGIFLKDSCGNKIWNNDFIMNIHSPSNQSQHLKFDGDVRNEWNMTYPCGGNYWDNLAIDDGFSGCNQTVPGRDGIADRPYEIDSYNKDYYPIMDKCGSLLHLSDTRWDLDGPKGIETRCVSTGIFSDSFISDLNFDETGKSLNFNISGGTFCKAIVCKELLDGVLEVRVDNVPMPCSLIADEKHLFANFSYAGGDHQVKIVGEFVTRIKGDVNNDGEVNITDLAIVAHDFGYKKPK